MKSKSWIVIAGLGSLALVGCETVSNKVSDTMSSIHRPTAPVTFADSVRQSAQGQTANAEAKNAIARQWEKGNAMARSGNKKLTKGQDDIDEGNRKLDEGKRLLDEGHRDVEEGTRRMQEAEASFHTQFPDTQFQAPAAPTAPAPAAPTSK